MKLKNKTVQFYKGKVHDLHVENSHSYNVENLGVHNSAGGSLVCYLLNITDLDPIRYDCRFDRFMNVHRCLSPDTKVLTKTGAKALSDLELYEHVQTHDGSHQRVVKKFVSYHDKIAVVSVGGQKIRCSLNHKWVVTRDGVKMTVQTSELQINDDIEILQ